MSRLSNLFRQVETQDPQLAADLKREIEALSGRRAFGLNFERHIPETVELPHRPVGRGDKVRFLPECGEKPSSVDRRLWWVGRIRRTDEGRVADLANAFFKKLQYSIGGSWYSDVQRPTEEDQCAPIRWIFASASLRDSDAGMKASAVAVKYHVSASWVRRLKQRRRETGEVAPRQQRYGRRPVLTPQLHTLAALIREQPDRTP